jgi:signal transduction histidine kinase
MTAAVVSTIERSRAAIPRWAIAIVVLAILVAFGQWSTAPTIPERQRLGFHVQPQGDHLVVTWVQPAGLGWDGHLRPGDVLLTADGNPVGPNDDLKQVSRAHTVTFQSGATRHMATALNNGKTTLLEEISLFLIAACFALVGVGVFVLSNDLIAASVMLANGTFGAMLFEQLAPGASSDPFYATVLYLSTVAFGASLLLLTWVFPINWLKTKRFRWIAIGSLIPSIALMGTFLYSSRRNPMMYEWLRNLSYLIHTANLLGALALVLIALFWSSPEQREARRAMGIVGLGMIASFLPFVVLLVIPHFMGVPNLAPFALVTLSTVFLPISFGIAVTSRQFLGVTRLLRRGLVALVVWMFLIVLLSVSVRRIERSQWSHAHLGTENPFLTALLVALVAIALWPSQSWLRRRAESLLFRDVYDYQETLRQLSVEIVEIRGLEAIAEHVLSRLVTVLDLTWAKITLHTDSGIREICHCAVSPACDSSCAMRTPDHAARTEPLTIEHETIGTLSLGPKRHDVTHNPEDIALVTTLAPMIATALQSALLLRRLEEQVDQLVDREQELAALSAQLMQVQEEERSRLALDLHDDPLQRAILLAREISETSPPLDRARLRAEADEIISALRAICAGLRPPVLDDFGLVAGLETLVSEARARSELNVSLEVETPNEAEFGRLEPELETALYRVAQEALNNCVKHASATSVDVALKRTFGCVSLQVSDDGHGVIDDARSAGSATHLGLLGMRERLQPWDAVVKVESRGTGGTIVYVWVPLRGEL